MYAKLEWFYRSDDFKTARGNTEVKALVKTMAPDEVVLSNHFTINEVTKIFGISRMVKFDVVGHDLIPLSHNDVFWRGAEVDINRKRTAIKVRGA